jgi:hypothetical protein
MGMGWFEDPAEGERLGDPLARLAGAVSRMLDGLPPAAAPPPGRVAAAASAVILPHPAVPGCRLVIQLAEWSASVACWWSAGDDWRAHPGDPALFAEFPLRPGGIDRAVAWLERELRRPVAARARSYGPVHRRQWALATDGGELVVRQDWVPAWRDRDRGGAALAGTLAGPGSWLLGVAVAAALARWLLAALTPALLGASWLHRAAQVLDTAAFAALLGWFAVPAARRPARVRVPMLAGLVLATLGAALTLLPEPSWVAAPDGSAPPAPELLLSALPTLLGAAAVACYLTAFLGLPGRAESGPPWPRLLPAVAGLAWGIDSAVGLWWLARFEPAAPDEAALLWPGVLLSAGRAAATGLAVVLTFVAVDRRPAMARPAARAGLAGGILLVLAWSLSLQLGTSWLVPLIPQTLAAVVLGAPVLLAWFAGTALVAVAAAATQAQSRVAGSPSASVATASPRNPSARPSWEE